jgi:hypothetical protein
VGGAYSGNTTTASATPRGYGAGAGGFTTAGLRNGASGAAGVVIVEY